MRWALVVVGAVMILIGGVWTLQGINILLGSFMSNQPFWAIVGVLVMLAGASLCFFGWRRGVAR